MRYKHISRLDISITYLRGEFIINSLKITGLISWYKEFIKSQSSGLKGIVWEICIFTFLLRRLTSLSCLTCFDSLVFKSVGSRKIKVFRFVQLQTQKRGYSLTCRIFRVFTVWGSTFPTEELSPPPVYLDESTPNNLITPVAGKTTIFSHFLLGIFLEIRLKVAIHLDWKPANV